MGLSAIIGALIGSSGTSLESIIRSLFSSGQQGAWFDSDIATLFQDSGGTTPVTAVEQPIGKVLDKSGRDNHSLQATAAARPTYQISPITGRRNLLTYTEQFDNAAWTKGSLTVIANTVTAPDGTLTADKLQETAVAAEHYVLQSKTLTAETYTYAAYIKSAGRNWAVIYLSTGAVQATYFDLVNGVVGTTAAGVTATISDAGNGWWRCSVSRLCTAAVHYGVIDTALGDGVDVSHLGDGTSGIYIWGAQLELGSAPTAYQKVVSIYDVTEAGVANVYSLSLDGIDDSLSGGTGGGGSSGFFWCAAIKPTDGIGTNRTLWSDTGTNTGYRVRINASNQLELAAGNGTIYTTIASTATVNVGTGNVITVWDDGTNLNAQIGNGTVASVARPVVLAGTAGFTIGKDNGAASSFFAGNIYRQLYRKDGGVTDAQRASAKQYCAVGAGITL